MRSAKLSVLMLALAAVACGEDELAQGSGNLLDSEGDQDGEETDDRADTTPPADGGDFLDQCVNRGGSVGMIHVVFACDSVTVYSCKDISNVVLELENGERQRSEGGGLGQVHTFSGTNGGRIVGVWVKAGNNKSGAGPGFGERFDAPEQDCDPPEGGSGGTGGTCGSNDPDEVCAGAGGVGGNGGEPICEPGSEDPLCTVD